MSHRVYKCNGQICIRLKWLLFTTVHVIPAQLKTLKMSWIFKSQWVILNSCIVSSSGYSSIRGVSKVNDKRYQGNFFLLNNLQLGNHNLRYLWSLVNLYRNAILLPTFEPWPLTAQVQDSHFIGWIVSAKS